MGIYSFLSEHSYVFEPVFDGELHRFKVGTRKDSSGWFVGRAINDPKFKSEIKIMVIGDWAVNNYVVWHSKKRTTTYEKEVIDREQHKIELKRREIEKARNEKAIKKIDHYLSCTTEGFENFAYIKNKLIDKPYGNTVLCKTEDKTFLLVPLRDVHGKIWSAQRIFDDGTKRFIGGGRISGCFNLIGAMASPTIYICEGWATGVTIHKATGMSVICAMNTNNMIAVASELKGSLVADFIVCADNDRATEKRIGSNPGTEAAKQTAKILKCEIITPDFEDDKFTDFNDMEANFGLDKVREVFKVEKQKLVESAKYLWKFNGFFEIYDTKEGPKERPDYEGLADYMMGDYYLKCDDSLIYFWSGKHYKSISFLNLKKIINDNVKLGSSANVINCFYQKALIKSFFNFNETDEPIGYLNCKNGVLDVSKGTLSGHSPDMFFKYVLDHDYNTEAQCPTFLKSLELVTNGDADLKKLIQQVFGYCIAGGHPVAHKAFMFYGDGGNGKSTILTALGNLVGQTNSARVPLTLFDKPFSMISLDGKLVNLIDETPKFNINPEAFKNVVSGGYVRAAHKGKPEVDLKMNARVIFACNKLPNFKDDTDGMLRRLIIIPFNHKIPDKEADRAIDKKIKAEMSGILNWAIEGMRSLTKNNYQFKKGAATDDTMDQYRLETDSVYYFFEECTEFMDGPKGDDVFSQYADLYEEYKAMCIVQGLYKVSGRVFSRGASKYYRYIYEKNGHEFTEKDRQMLGYKKGVKRLRVATTYTRQMLKR